MALLPSFASLLQPFFQQMTAPTYASLLTLLGGGSLPAGIPSPALCGPRAARTPSTTVPTTASLPPPAGTWTPWDWLCWT